jgi:hypothetical protein
MHVGVSRLFGRRGLAGFRRTGGSQSPGSVGLLGFGGLVAASKSHCFSVGESLFARSIDTSKEVWGIRPGAIIIFGFIFKGGAKRRQRQKPSLLGFRGVYVGERLSSDLWPRFYPLDGARGTMLRGYL